MANMSYCRHENTARDLDDVWERWYDWQASESNEYEASARKRIVLLVREMHEQFEEDGVYDEVDA